MHFVLPQNRLSLFSGCLSSCLTMFFYSFNADSVPNIILFLIMCSYNTITSQNHSFVPKDPQILCSQIFLLWTFSLPWPMVCSSPWLLNNAPVLFCKIFHTTPATSALFPWHTLVFLSCQYCCFGVKLSISCGITAVTHMSLAGRQTSLLLPLWYCIITRTKRACGWREGIDEHRGWEWENWRWR